MNPKLILYADVNIIQQKLAVGKIVDATLKAIDERRLNSMVGAVDNTGGTGQGLKILKVNTEQIHMMDPTVNHYADLEDVVQALGTSAGVNLASAAITAFEL